MAKKNKYTYEEVKEFVRGLGFELISKEYINNRQKLILEDKEGYLYSISISALKMGFNPSKFGNKNIFTIKNIELWCNLNNRRYKLISNEYKGNNKHLKWECLKEGCKEEFDATWHNIYAEYGCPYCTGQKVGLSNCLATKNPKLTFEWHPTLNKDLTPYDVTSNSGKKVWWKCCENEDHEWETTIASRNNDAGCPFCESCKANRRASKEYNLAIIYPELVAEWNFIKNNKYPEEYTPVSGEKVHWKCKDKNHEWEAPISNRSKHGCPYCAGFLPSEDNNLLIKNPILCLEWNYARNLKQPHEYTFSSGQKVWWKCVKNHEWESTIDNRNQGRGCPECNESKGEKEIDNVLTDNNWIKITQEEFNILNDFDKCIKNYFIAQKTFDGLRGVGNGLLSYDHYLPNINLLIEYQGQYHDGTVSSQTQEEFEYQKEHDRRKRQYCLDNNIELLEIWYWNFDNIEIILDEYLLNLNNKMKGVFNNMI